MPRPKSGDPSVNAGISLPQSLVNHLDKDAKKFGFESRAALVQAFFKNQYPAFLWNLELKKDK